MCIRDSIDGFCQLPQWVFSLVCSKVTFLESGYIINFRVHEMLKHKRMFCMRWMEGGGGVPYQFQDNLTWHSTISSSECIFSIGYDISFF